MNYSALSKEATILKDHSKRAWKCWMWIMIGLVMVIFICKLLKTDLRIQYLLTQSLIHSFTFHILSSYGPVYENYEKTYNVTQSRPRDDVLTNKIKKLTRMWGIFF